MHPPANLLFRPILRGLWTMLLAASVAAFVVALSPLDPTDQTVALVISTVLIAVFSLACGFIEARRLYRQRLREWRVRTGLFCAHCGYDLRATIGRCPECGHDIALPLQGCSTGIGEGKAGTGR